MAKGEFVWVIGNDDLLLPNSLKKLNKIILGNKKLDFFFKLLFIKIKLRF